MTTKYEQLAHEWLKDNKYADHSALSTYNWLLSFARCLDSQEPVKECLQGFHKYQTIKEVNQCVICGKDCTPIYVYPSAGAVESNKSTGCEHEKYFTHRNGLCADGAPCRKTCICDEPSIVDDGRNWSCENCGAGGVIRKLRPIELLWFPRNMEVGDCVLRVADKLNELIAALNK